MVTYAVFQWGKQNETFIKNLPLSQSKVLKQEYFFNVYKIKLFSFYAYNKHYVE